MICIAHAIRPVMLALGLLFATGCAAPGKTASEKTLYDDLGGKEGVEILTADLIREIAADPRIRGHYKDTDIGRFHHMMQLQMCETTGGGCVYPGDDMVRTHGGMNITKTEFNGGVEAMMRAMDKNKVPVATQNRVLELYAPMRSQIIGH